MEQNLSCPERLAKKFGNPSEAARKLGVDRQSMYQWINNGYIPPQQALAVERLTDGEIKIREMLEEAESVKPVVSKYKKNG